MSYNYPVIAAPGRGICRNLWTVVGLLRGKGHLSVVMLASPQGQVWCTIFLDFTFLQSFEFLTFLQMTLSRQGPQILDVSAKQAETNFCFRDLPIVSRFYVHVSTFA